MSRGPDAATLLERALVADAARSGTPLAVVETVSTRWASATFAGARHVLTVSGAEADAWLATLPEAELPLRGHLVADIAVVGQGRTPAGWSATIEALTVEER